MEGLQPNAFIECIKSSNSMTIEDKVLFEKGKYYMIRGISLSKYGIPKIDVEYEQGEYISFQLDLLKKNFNIDIVNPQSIYLKISSGEKEYHEYIHIYGDSNAKSFLDDMINITIENIARENGEYNNVMKCEICKAVGNQFAKVQTKNFVLYSNLVSKLIEVSS